MIKMIVLLLLMPTMVIEETSSQSSLEETVTPSRHPDDTPQASLRHPLYANFRHLSDTPTHPSDNLYKWKI